MSRIRLADLALVLGATSLTCALNLMSEEPALLDAAFGSVLAVLLAFGVRSAVRAARAASRQRSRARDARHRSEAEAAAEALASERERMSVDIEAVVRAAVVRIEQLCGRARTSPAEDQRPLLREVQAEGRAAAVELRRLLGLLRDDVAPGPVDPVPAFAHVVRRRDLVLGGAVAVEALVESLVLPPGAGLAVVAFQLGLTMAAAATIGLWRLNPGRACSLAAAIIGVGVVLRAPAVTGAWMVFTIGGLMWACVARPMRDRATVAGPAALVVAVTLSQWAFFHENAQIALVVMAGALATGAAFRVGERSRAAAESYAAAREHALAAAASAAVRANRLAVARELHDAISGTIGVIVLQAGAAEMLWLQDTARARAALDVVATATDHAQRELDELLPRLSVLDRAAPDFSPHGIEAVPELADRMRRGGVRVATHLEGPVGEVPPPVALTAYRIVQECLANSARHAPGAPVRVAVRALGSAVEVEVADDGPGAATLDRNGFGLVGLAERVQGLGGALTVGTGDAGRGFRVSARLPVPETTEASP